MGCGSLSRGKARPAGHLCRALAHGLRIDVESQSGRDRWAQADNEGVYVNPISAWEIAVLVAKGRLRLSLAPEIWFEGLLGQPGVRLSEMSPGTLIASAFLPGNPPRDPADRIIAATCRRHGFVLITRDGELIPFAKAGHLEAIAC